MPILPFAAIDLAERQRGVLARFQLLRWSSDKAIDGRVRRGSLVRIHRGVYRVAGGAALPEQEAFAAALRARPGATITGPFALGWFDVDGFTLSEPFEVLVRPGRSLRHVGFEARPDPSPSRRTVAIGEIRLVTPVDALLDAAAWRTQIGDRRLRVAYDHMRWSGLVTGDRLRRRIEERGFDDPAVAAFRGLFEDQDLASESEGERLLAPILRRLDPTPESQVWIGPRRRVDWYLHELRYGWEYLGSVDHAAAAQRLADAERDRELAAEGVKLSYVTARDLRDPSALLATIVGALTVRADQLGVAPPAIAPV